MARVEILEQRGRHFLWIDDELWMWDVPQEIEDQKEIANQAFGDVLVAGYGFGIVQRFLAENQKVASILTVEIEPGVLKECKRVFGKIYGNVTLGDFNNFQSERLFDCVVGDIWIDQALRNINEYTEFKTKAQTLLKPDGKILGWGHDYFEYLFTHRDGYR